MAMPMTVSIALCTYNGEKFLREQLASLMSQSLAPNEVVIADDGSKDATLQIIEDFSRNAPFAVRLLHGRVGGPTQNFERAMIATTGDIVLLCDQDDIWHTSKVAEFAATFHADPSLVCVLCDANLVDSAGHSLRKTLWQSIGFEESARRRFVSGDHGEFLLKRTIAFGLTMGLRRPVIDHLSPVPMPFGHDNFASLIAAAMGGVTLIPHTLLDYRQHGRQVSGAKTTRFGRRPSQYSLEPNASSYQAALERIQMIPVELRSNQYATLSDALSRKVDHLRFRENLSVNRLERAKGIFREFSHGHYEEFSNGLRSAVKDFL